MRKVTTTLATLAACAFLAGSAMAANPVRISQVYSGGGSSNVLASYSKDYVEIFNSGASAVNIGDWVLEYGSATGNWGSSTSLYFVFPTNTMIAGCSYILVATGAVGTGGAAVPSPDFTTTNLSMGAASGKVGLFNALNANIACGSETVGTLVDKVAWGTGNCPETTALATLTISTGGIRNSGGLDDTDDNVADFTIVTSPVPRNSASPQNAACLPVPTTPSTWSGIKGARY